MPKAHQSRAGGQAHLDNLLERVERQSATLLDIAQDSSFVAGDFELSVRMICERTADALEVERVAVWLLVADSEQARGIDLYRRSVARHETPLTLRLDEFAEYFDTIGKVRTLAVEDVLTDARTRRAAGYYQSHRVRSILDAAIRVDGRLAGGISIGHPDEPRCWTPDEVGFVAGISDHLAMAYINAQRVDALQALGEADQRYRAFVATIGEGISRIEYRAPIPVTLSPGEQLERMWQCAYFAECNDMFAKMYDFGSAQEIEGKNLSEVLPRTEEIDESYRKFVERGYCKVNEETVEPDGMGGYRHFINNWIGMVEDDHVVREWGTQIDITELRQAQRELERYRDHLEELVAARTDELQSAQQQLLANDRLATIGKLTATVSHELRNPLGTIQTNLELLAMRVGKTDPKAMAWLDRINRNMTRCNAIIAELLAYGRIRHLEFQPMAIDPLLRLILDELVIPEPVVVQTDLRSAATISLDPERFRQAFVNVTQNAWQAMTESVKPTRAHARLTVSSATVGARLEILISDTGPGIPESEHAVIFEPLQTSRRMGVGLGLPLAKEIMERHGGGVEVRSGDGTGATMVLWFPLEKA